MRASLLVVGLVFLVALVSSCSGGSSAPPPPESYIHEDGTISRPPAPENGLQLHTGPWTVNPGEEIHRCMTTKLEESLLVARIESFASAKMHHYSTDVTIAAVPEGDHDYADVYSKDVMENSMTVYATVLPYDNIVFPANVAGKLPANFVNVVSCLHYINLSDKPRTAEAYLNLSTTPRENVKTLINGIQGSSWHFTLPPHADTTITGTCKIDRPLDIIALDGHAHARLTSLQIRLIKGGVRPDAPTYVTKDPQTPQLDRFPAAPIHLEPGDSMEWSCAYTNTTDHPIDAGDTTADEMCMAIAVYMPDQGFLTCNVSPKEPSKTVTQQTPPAGF